MKQDDFNTTNKHWFLWFMVKGHYRDAILKQLSLYGEILNIAAHRCHIDKEFKEVISNDRGYITCNTDRYGKYLDYKRYSFDKFVRNTRQIYPLSVRMLITQRSVAILRLYGFPDQNAITIPYDTCDYIDNLFSKFREYKRGDIHYISTMRGRMTVVSNKVDVTEQFKEKIKKLRGKTFNE